MGQHLVIGVARTAAQPRADLVRVRKGFSRVVNEQRARRGARRLDPLREFREPPQGLGDSAGFERLPCNRSEHDRNPKFVIVPRQCRAVDR